MTTVTATFRITQWNDAQILNRASRILTEYAKQLAEQTKTEIQTSQFSWPRITHRRNGSLVGSPRNIVDTGAFLNSQRSYRLDPLRARIAWGGSGGVSYAGIILRGKSNYPRRDWISPAVAKLPIGPFFANNWSRLS